MDLDREIERLAGAGIAAVFESRGEEAFRDLETLALAAALAEGKTAAALGPRGRVVGCGGGILGRAENRTLLKRRACAIWLKVDPRTAAARLGALGDDRPLLRGGPVAERLRALLDARASAYAAAADGVVETGGRSPEDVAGAIVLLWEAFRRRWASSES